MINLELFTKSKVFRLIILVFLIGSCELHRDLAQPISYPLLGAINLTNGQEVGNFFSLSGTAYHSSGITGITISLTEISNSNTLLVPLNIASARLASFSHSFVLSNYGAYVISFSAENGYGSVSNSEGITIHYTSQSISDTTAPTLLLSSPLPGQTVGSSYQLSGTVRDNQSGVSGLYWKLDDAVFIPLQVLSSNFSTNINLTTIGLHTNYIYSRDNVGNFTTTNSIIVDYQSGIPFITIDHPANNTYYKNSQITQFGSAGVDIATLTHISISHNQGLYNDISLSTNWTNTSTLIYGTNTFQTRVIADNNLTNYSTLLTLYLDDVPPVFDILTPTNNSEITQANILLTGTAQDSFSGLEGVYLAVDDYNYSYIANDQNWNKSFVVSEGLHTLRVYIKDNAGNSSITNERIFTYTNLSKIDETMTIYYYNYKQWSNPTIYAWIGSLEPAGGWSGSPMSAMGDDWYSYTFNTNVLLNIIFSDNGLDQSKNLSHDGTGWYKPDTWYQVNPDWLAQASASPGGGYFTNESISVTLKYSGSNVLFSKYTTDGTIPGPFQGTAYNNNDNIMIGSSMIMGEHKTLRLWVSNSFGEDSQSYTYIKTNALPSTSFRWENATIYFVLIDRFKDGNIGNSASYGREWDSSHTSPGKFHGGDLAGLTQKLNEGYFTNMGINVIWISCPMEQMHGWVEGGAGAFKYYGYHGYYPIDWTKMDANYGTTSDFQTFVDTAHQQGVRVLIDIIMNHTGYAPIEDLNEYSIDVLYSGWENAVPGQFHQYIDYFDNDWIYWWGSEWIRADLPNYDNPVDGNNYTGSFSGLTDFKTESTSYPSSLPVFYANKPDTLAVYHSDWTVRDYLINWICDWVRTYGIDGFRCDTAKHVEMEGWVDLKTNAVAALREWKQNNPSKKLDDLDLWMTGEHWNWGKGGLSKTWDDPEWPGDYTDYITSGAFDSMINFDPQNFLADKLNQSYNSIDSIYTTYASLINSDPEFNTLSYLSSHDTILWYEGGNNRTVNTTGSQSNPTRHNKTANYFFFFPGAVQIFYGDELGRTGITSDRGSDQDQLTRSFMPWGNVGNAIHQHWQILGRFRNKHLSVGAGQHVKLADSPYTFSRTFDLNGSEEDKVIIVMGVSGSTTIDVSSVFANNTTVRDYYTGDTDTVNSGQVTFTPGIGSDIILIEKQ